MRRTRDIVVIGGSAGAVEGLVRLMPNLPAALPARLFVTVHVPATTSALPAILARVGHLAARHPSDHEPTEPSVVYVAPPDHHLLVQPGHVRVVRGPRENGHRPAVDTLFRSAASSYGARVVSVVLSGNLHDGSAGAAAVRDAGGLVIVQDPAECSYPGMPRAALTSVPQATVLPLQRIADHLIAVVETPLTDVPLPTDGLPTGAMPDVDPVMLAGSVAETLLAEQGTSIEAALWTALRALEDRIAMTRRLEKRAESSGTGHARDRYAHNVITYQQQAQAIRDLLRPGFPVGDDAERVRGARVIHQHAAKPVTGR